MRGFHLPNILIDMTIDFQIEKHKTNPGGIHPLVSYLSFLYQIKVIPNKGVIQCKYVIRHAFKKRVSTLYKYLFITECMV
jgi:hypothetical protein